MKLYYIAQNGVQDGPFDTEAIIAKIAANEYDINTLVWTEGMSSWEPISNHFTMPEPPKTATPPPPPPPRMQGSAEDSQSEKPNTASFSDTLQSTISNLKQAGLHAADVAGKATGLGKIDGFSFKKFFKEIFSKHSFDEVLDFFCCGTRTTTPNIQDVTATWPAPWVFSRIFIFFLILYIGFLLGLTHFQNLNLVPGLIFVGCFAIPFCVCIFFFEMNIKRDMPFFEIIKGFMIGGIFSLIITLFLFKYASLFEGAWWAGFIEEPAKLAATLLIASPLYRKGNVLHGMAMGCAVGAGFAAFESAGYVYRYLSMGQDLIMAAQLGNVDLINLTATFHYIPINMSYDEFMSDPDTNIQHLIEAVNPERVLIMRALYAPFCHVVWSAITVGAFYHVMAKRAQEPDKKQFDVDVSMIGNKLTFGLYRYSINFSKDENEEGNKSTINLRVFADYRFLSIFILPILLHAFWNSEILIEYSLLRNLLIGATGWLLAFLLLQIGINQVKQEKLSVLQQSEKESEEPTSDPAS